MNEIINSQGFRQDGRGIKEIRRMKCIINDSSFKNIDGSIYYEQGQTKLIVSVIGPIPLPASNNNSNVIINCNFRISPFYSQERRKRNKNDKFCIESSLMISRTFSSVITELYNKTQIIINIIVLEGDGSVRSAAINASSIALAIAGISMKDLIVSTTCGLYGEQILYDLTQTETENLKSNILIAINSTEDDISPVTIDINTKINQNMLNILIEESFIACKQVSVKIRNFLKQYTCNKYLNIFNK